MAKTNTQNFVLGFLLAMQETETEFGGAEFEGTRVTLEGWAKSAGPLEREWEVRGLLVSLRSRFSSDGKRVHGEPSPLERACMALVEIAVAFCNFCKTHDELDEAADCSHWMNVQADELMALFGPEFYQRAKFRAQ